MAIPAIPFGDTFLVNCTYTDQSNTPIDLDTAGVTAAAKIVVPSGMGSFPVAVTPADQSTSPGQFTISSDTSTWVTSPNQGGNNGCQAGEIGFLMGIDPTLAYYMLGGLPGCATDSGNHGAYVDPPTVGEWQLRISYTSAAGTFSAAPISFRLI